MLGVGAPQDTYGAAPLEKQDEFALAHRIHRPLSNDRVGKRHNLPHTQLGCVNWITLD